MEIYKICSIFFFFDDKFQKITSATVLLNTDSTTIVCRFRTLRNLGPNIECIRYVYRFIKKVVNFMTPNIQQTFS
jgi:hypothetical protein